MNTKQVRRKAHPAPRSNSASDSNSSTKSYAVGYGRPPKHSQFKPGRSGNPKGRPKGRKTLRSRLTAVLNSKIVKREGNKRQLITVLEGMLWKQIENGLKGSERAFLSVIKVCAALGLLSQLQSASEEIALSRAEEELVAELVSRVGLSSKED